MDRSAVVFAIKKALFKGHSFLRSVKPPPIPYVHGVKTYYGEQMFSYMANGVFKKSDSKKGTPIYVPLKSQGFDVQIPFHTSVHRVEVKTIYKGSIIDLSAQQLDNAQVIAIYNPQSTVQNFVFREISYNIPAQSYLIVKN